MICPNQRNTILHRVSQDALKDVELNSKLLKPCGM